MTLEIRPFRSTDIPQLLAVWNASIPYDTISETRFAHMILLDPNFQSEYVAIAEADGKVVGFVLGLVRRVPYFLETMETDSAWITAFGVHPDYQQQGIGRALFDYLFQKLSAINIQYVRISPYVPNYIVPGVDIESYQQTVQVLTDKFGFKTTSIAISMGVNLTQFSVPDDIIAHQSRLETDDSITIRPTTINDIPDVLNFLIEKFGWDWYRHASDYLRDYVAGSQDICFLVAHQADQVVGFCQQRQERFGPFGVDPAMRGKGIGRVLLFRCLELMRSKRFYYTYFLWTDERAAKLYATAGFQRVRQFAILEKQL